MALFTLANNFGCTVRELEERLTFDEFIEWLAYLKMQSDAAKLPASKK